MKSIVLEECSILTGIFDVISPNFVTRRDGVVFALCYSSKGYFSGSSEEGNYLLVNSSLLSEDCKMNRCLCIKDCGSFRLGRGYTRIDMAGSVNNIYAILENDNCLPEYCSLDSICNTTYRVNDSRNIISLALPIDYSFNKEDNTVLIVTEKALDGKVMGYIDLSKQYKYTEYITSTSFPYCKFNLDFNLVLDTKLAEVDVIPFYELLKVFDDIIRG